MVFDKKQYTKDYYVRTKEERLKYNAQYYKANKDKLLEKQREYYKEYYRKNKEKINNTKREKYADNPNKKRAKNLKHYHDNKEYYRLWGKTEIGLKKARRNARKRRLKLAGLKQNFTQEEWDNKVEATKGICPYCNAYIGENKMTQDHTIPISKAEEGHTYTINDVEPMCLSCNDKKGTSIYIAPKQEVPEEIKYD